MKKLLLILLCFPIIGFGQSTYVPDDNFEQELINLGYDSIIDDYVLTSNINFLDSLNLSALNISDLTGIEDFISLTHLWCNNNQLTSLNINNLTDLTWLKCDFNQLTNLDVSNNINLENLYCQFQLLTSLDIANNPSLIELDCRGNQISTLDLSNQTYLTLLDCSYNQLTNIDISSNPNIITFISNSNSLISLDVRNSNNINMTYVIMTQNPNLTCISVDDTTWSNFNWTVSNGNIDPQHYFSNNCSPNSIEEHPINKQLLKVTDLLGREAKQKNQSLFYIYDDGSFEKKIIIK